MSESYTYVYCLMRCAEPRQFAAPGIGGRGDRVYTIMHRDLAAVVSDVAEAEYDSTRRNMLCHTAVQEEAMRETTILPMRFGTIAPSAASVTRDALAPRYDEICRLLDSMSGRVELGLKAFWRDDLAFREIVETEPDIRRLRDSLLGRPQDETYYERIRLGKLVEQAIERKRAADAAAVVERLRPLARDLRVNSLAGDQMVLNAAFLVDREAEPGFDQAVQALDAELGQRLKLKYTGNIPPYNFVSLTIHWA